MLVMGLNGKFHQTYERAILGNAQENNFPGLISLKKFPWQLKT